MTSYDVVNTYFANFKQYTRLLSIDEELDDLNKFITYLNKEYHFNDEQRRYTCIKKLVKEKKSKHLLKI